MHKPLASLQSLYIYTKKTDYGITSFNDGGLCSTYNIKADEANP